MKPKFVQPALNHEESLLADIASDIFAGDTWTGDTDVDEALDQFVRGTLTGQYFLERMQSLRMQAYKQAEARLEKLREEREYGRDGL